MRMKPSFTNNAANREPSGLNDGARTSRPFGLFHACRSFPVFRSQTLAEPSSPVVPSRAPQA